MYDLSRTAYTDEGIQFQIILCMENIKIKD